MTWTIHDLGAMGEFLGSIAVLATLIYLAVQVRHARADSRAALLQHRSDAVRELWLSIAGDDRLAAAWGKQLAYALGDKLPAHASLESIGLDPVEAIRLERWIAANFFHRQTIFKADLDSSERQELDDQLINMYRDGASGTWFDSTFPEGRKHGFDRDFVEHVRALRGQSSA